MITNAHPFIRAVEATIRRYDMLAPGETILVGVSGGPDSMALLHCLIALREKWSLTLVVGHLHHGIRKEGADRDAAFVQRVSADLGLNCKIRKENVKSFCTDRGLSLQEGARRLRYRLYDEAAREYEAEKVALGHQGDDNAESVMMHLLRGTGPRGLTGIPAVRNGRIVRPLIDVTRQDIVRFLRENEIGYVEDASNRDLRYLRNRVRHELFPLLKSRYGVEAGTVLNRLAETMKEEEDFWQVQVNHSYQSALVAEEGGRITLSVDQLKGLHPALRHRCIRRAVFRLKGDTKRLERKHVMMISQLVDAPCGPTNDLPQGVRVSRALDTLVFSRGCQDRGEAFAHEIHGPGEMVIPEVGLRLKASICPAEGMISRLTSFPPTVACVDYRALSFPLIVRNIRPGDRFVPLGMSGSQKVKDFFINRKVPRPERRRIPLVWSGKRLVWVAGHRIDEAVRVHRDTERILKLELSNGHIKD